MLIKISIDAVSDQSLIWYSVNLNNRQEVKENECLIALNADAAALAEITTQDVGWKNYVNIILTAVNTKN